MNVKVKMGVWGGGMYRILSIVTFNLSSKYQNGKTYNLIKLL